MASQVVFSANPREHRSEDLLLINMILLWIAYVLVGVFAIYVFCNLRIKLENWSYIRWLLLVIAATYHTISSTVAFLHFKDEEEDWNWKWWEFYLNYYV